MDGFEWNKRSAFTEEFTKNYNKNSVVWYILKADIKLLCIRKFGCIR